MTLHVHPRSDSTEWAQELRMFIEEDVISILAMYAFRCYYITLSIQ